MKRTGSSFTPCLQPKAPKIGDTLYKNLQLMIMGEMKPEEVISESVSYADTILNE